MQSVQTASAGNMSLEVDNRRNDLPIPYQKQEDKEAFHGYGNVYETNTSPPAEAQDRVIRRLRTTIRGLTVGLVLALILAIVTAGVAGSLAAKRNHTTVIAR